MPETLTDCKQILIQCTTTAQNYTMQDCIRSIVFDLKYIHRIRIYAVYLNRAY